MVTPQIRKSLLSSHTAIVLLARETGRFLAGLRWYGPGFDADRAAVFGELIPDRLLSPVELQQMLGTQTS